MLLETAVAMTNHKDDSWKEVIEKLNNEKEGGTFQVKNYIKRSGDITREVYKVLPENHFQKVFIENDKLCFGSELSSSWLNPVTQDYRDPIVLDYPEKQPKRSRRLCANRNSIGGML